jgi:hypothetical protein
MFTYLVGSAAMASCAAISCGICNWAYDLPGPYLFTIVTDMDLPRRRLFARLVLAQSLFITCAKDFLAFLHFLSMIFCSSVRPSVI